MPSSPGPDDTAELFAFGPDVKLPPPPRPKKRTVPRVEAAHRASRRARTLAGVLTISLLALSTGVWLSPPIRQWGKGPSAVEVELATERARSGSLKNQLDELNRRLKQPRPIATDMVAAARAADLKRQVEALEDKLGIPRPPVTDNVQQARADDLAARLNHAEEVLKQPRPPVTDPSAAARADDLAAQNNQLETQLTRPRPVVDPLESVHPALTKADILASRNQFGLYTTQSPFNYGEIDLIQAGVQRKANIVGYFQSFNDPFNAFPIKNAWLRGQIPLMTWESQSQVGSITANQPEFSLPNILAGNYDNVIRAYADGIRDNAMPVIIRFDHEMNGTWYPWSEWADAKNQSINGNSVGQYTEVWRHVHDIFQAEGANNYTIWLWSPNRINRICAQRDPINFYPGDAYVDLVGMSGYYRNYQSLAGPCDNIDATFEAVFGATLPKLRAATSKPLFLSEIGAGEDGGQKVKWINDLFAGLARNPDIIGFSWFSLSVSSGGELDRETHDWRINSSAAPEAAMRANLAATGFGVATG